MAVGVELTVEAVAVLVEVLDGAEAELDDTDPELTCLEAEADPELDEVDPELDETDPELTGLGAEADDDPELDEPTILEVDPELPALKSEFEDPTACLLAPTVYADVPDEPDDPELDEDTVGPEEYE